MEDKLNSRHILNDMIIESRVLVRTFVDPKVVFAVA